MSATKQSFAESFARKIYAAVAAMLAATVARKVVERLWLKTTGKVPPEEPASPEVHWKDAVAWSALSGTAVGVARLLATRKAAGAWERVSDDGSSQDDENEKAASRSRD